MRVLGMRAGFRTHELESQGVHCQLSFRNSSMWFACYPRTLFQAIGRLLWAHLSNCFTVDCRYRRKSSSGVTQVVQLCKKKLWLLQAGAGVLWSGMHDLAQFGTLLEHIIPLPPDVDYEVEESL